MPSNTEIRAINESHEQTENSNRDYVPFDLSEDLILLRHLLISFALGPIRLTRLMGCLNYILIYHTNTFL